MRSSRLLYWVSYLINQDFSRTSGCKNKAGAGFELSGIFLSLQFSQLKLVCPGILLHC
jgi:hypothetical protein